MTLLDDLVKAYVNTDLKTVFAEGGIDVNQVPQLRHPELKDISLAQWILESGRGTSRLAIEHLNFAGMKFRPELAGLAISVRHQAHDGEDDYCKFDSLEKFIKGYWKFLTRSPYQGWEDHTNTPENFIGFIGRIWATDDRYVSKVLDLLPEAKQHITRAEGLTPPPVTRLQLIAAPNEVEVGKSFVIQGLTAPDDAGKPIQITVDDRFTSSGPGVSDDGRWQVAFSFNQAGNRRLRVTIDGESVEFRITVKLAPSTARLITLSASVGRGGTNRPNDVQAVKARLRELGFDWVSGGATVDTGTIKAIQLFQSIIDPSNDAQEVRGDGRIDVNGPTHKFLQAVNAPRWQLMDVQGNGFVNGERKEAHDNHDFGTSWMNETLHAIGKTYQQQHRNTHPNASPFPINDVSIPHGGNTPDHSGHEIGCACDVFLPRKDGGFGLAHFNNPQFDRDAARAILKAIHQQPLVNKNRIFFNDPTLIREGLCKFSTAHHHHIHFEIKPPSPA